VAAAIYNNPGYRAAQDYEMVGTITYFPFLIVTPADSKIPSLSALLANARANPGKVAYGSAGMGASNHLSGELFALRTGTQLTHVPYKGNAPAMTDVIGGQIQMMFDIVGGRVPTLPVAGSARLP